MEITKYEFERYEEVRKNGRTNMIMISTVQALSGLEKDQVLFIIKNYGELSKKYLSDDSPNIKKNQAGDSVGSCNEDREESAGEVDGCDALQSDKPDNSVNGSTPAKSGRRGSTPQSGDTLLSKEGEVNNG